MFRLYDSLIHTVFPTLSHNLGLSISWISRAGSFPHVLIKNVLIKGNCCSCLRNVITLFQHIEKERAWRKSKGRAPGFETLNVRKPIGMEETEGSVRVLLLR